MKRNSFLFLISFVIGILFCYFLKENNLKIIFLSSFTFVIIVLIILKINKNLIYFCIFFLLGLSITFLNTKESVLTKYFDKKVNIIADVISINKMGNLKKYQIYIKSVNEKNIKEKTILYTNQDLNIADRIFLRAKINKLNNNTNPRLFNFKKINLKNEIYTKIYQEKVKILSKSDNKFLRAKREFNLYIKKVLDNSLNKKNSNIIKRIFLVSQFDEDFEKNVNEIGISHILAVSGLHIGIIFILINKMLTYLYINRKVREFIALFFIFLYSNFISNPPSVLRAEIFLTIYILTKCFYKINDSLNTLYLSSLIILINNPFMLFDIGFNLSFLSVFALIYILPYFKEKKESILKRSFKITLSILIVTLPIILYNFGEISLFLFLANIVLVPIFIFVIILSFILLLLSLISIKISLFLGIIIDFLLDMLRFNIDFLSKINIKIEFYNFNIALVILYYFLIFLIIKKRIFKNFCFDNKKFLNLAIFIMIISINLFDFYKDETKINFIEIGQGDSCLIRTNFKNILIDTGGNVFDKSDNGKTILIPYLKKQGVNKLDYVFISHLDADHCKNLKLLCKKIKVKTVIFRKNGYKDYLKKYGKIQAKKIINIENFKKMKIDKLQLEIFQVINALSENDKSIVINLKTHNKKILFTGDISMFSENQLLKNNISCDYLKVAHHGSKYSNTNEFLLSTKPKTAIISCGYKNIYKHPHKETIERIKKVAKKIYRTDLDGNIILKINKIEEKIISFNKINEDLIENLKFYFTDIFLILLYLLSFIILTLTRRKYELYTSIKTFR